METGALISLLRERNVKLSVDKDRLKLSAPPGVLDAALRATVASRKEDILAYVRRAEELRGAKALVAVKPEGSMPPIFGVSGYGADAYYFVSLARHLDAEQPLMSVDPKGLDGSEPLDSVEALARFAIEEIRRYTPNGPYLIAGHCTGGIVAFEVARQLTAAGHEVPLVALIGTPFPYLFNRIPLVRLRMGRHFRSLLTGSLDDRKRYIRSKLQRRQRQAASDAAVSPEALAARKRVEAATTAAVRSYTPQYYPGQVDHFVTSDEPRQADPWQKVTKSVRVHDLTKYGRDELLLGAYASVLAAPLRERLKSLA